MLIFDPRNFLSPVAGYPLVSPMGYQFDLFFFISLRELFFGFYFSGLRCAFLNPEFFLMWRTVDGGGWWWWMGSKKVLWFCSKFCQMKFTAYKSSVFWKICEKLFLSEKNPTSSFKIGGIFRKKMFPKFLETSVIISLI